MFGGKSIGSTAMNQHKAMAGAGNSGSFGVSKFPARDVAHPDVGMKHEAMDDMARGAKPAIKGNGGLMQASPDHGPQRKDHFTRDGKA